MKICKLKDFETVYNFFIREDFVGDITDDLSPHMFDAVKNMLTKDLVCMPTEGTAFVFRSVNSTLYEVHLNTTEGEKTDVCGNTLIMAEWLKSNTNIASLLSYIPIVCESTLHYANKIGMKRIGIVKDGFLKNGAFVDNIIMSANVEDIIKELSWLQQQ